MSADPDTLVVLTSARTEFEGRAKAAVLEDAGIPARVFATAATTIQWEGGYNDPIKVMVRRADVERASAVLRQNRRDSVDLDWSEIDVGHMEEGATPATPASRLELAIRRSRVRRIGMILIGAAFLVGFLSPAMAVPIAAGALILIVLSWNDDKPTPTRSRTT